MVKMKTSLFGKMMAILLAAAITISMLPMDSLTVTAAGAEIILSGTVNDQAGGGGLAGVSVILTSETADAVTEGITTDENGNYAATLTANAAYTVTFSKEGYKDAVLSYTDADTTADITGAAVSMEAKQEDTTFAFTGTAPDAVAYGETFTNTAASVNQADAVVTYSSSDENVAVADASTGTVTAVNVGTAIIYAALPESADYKAAEVSYELTIVKADQTGFAFAVADPGVQSWGAGSYQNTAGGGEGSGAVEYTVIAGSDCASVDKDTGVLTYSKAGTVTVEAVKAEDEHYNAVKTSYTITIVNNQQTDFGFSESAPSVVYGENGNCYMNAPNGVAPGAVITYSITDQKDADGNAASDVAGIDPDTGELMINTAGTVSVQARSTGAAGYDDAEAGYVLTISRADRSLTFADGTAVSVYYGEKGKTYTNAAQGADNTAGTDGNGDGTGEITYELTTGTVGSGIIEAFDTDTGAITFRDGETGSATVTAAIAADRCYNACSASYTITVAYPQVPAAAYEVYGDTCNDSGWYTGNVVIAAPVGYQISDSNALENNVWTSSVSWDAEWNNDGPNPNPVIYLRDETTGAITEAVTVTEEIKLDQGNPVIYDIEYEETAVEKVIEKITFGLYSASEINVTISAYDSISGIESLAYAYTSDQTVAGSTGKEETGITVQDGAEGIEIDKQTGKVSYTFKIPAEFRGKVRASATDAAGRKSEIVSEETIVVDNEAPVMTVELLGENGKEASAEKYENCYNQTITAEIKITESNFMPDATTASVNGTTAAFDREWRRAEQTDTWMNTITFSEDGEYTLKVDTKDLLDKPASGEVHFIVDKTPPAVDDMQIAYSSAVKTWQKVLNAVTFGYYAYKDEVTVTITARDNAAGVDSFGWIYTQEENTSTTQNVAVKTGEITGQDIKYSSDGKTASASFTLDATEAEQFRGSVAFTVTDKAGNKSAVKKDGTRINIVDNISPERTVTYSAAYKVVDAATFEEKESYQYDAEQTNAILYYKGDMTATFTVTEANFYPEDAVIKVNGKAQDAQGWGQSGDVWTRSITLTEDGEYTISMNYTDRSGNRMTSYTSEKIIIDTAAPKAEIRLLDAKGKDAEYESNENYFKQAVTAEIVVTDPNFAPELAKVSLNGEDVEIKAWQQDTAYTDTWSYAVPLRTDGYYTIKADVVDRLDRTGTASAELCVDGTAPGADRMTITYSEELNSWEKVLNAVTFGYYAYVRDVQVTVTAWDDTSGIDYFIWNYTKEDSASAVNVTEKSGVIGADRIEYSQDGKTATARFTLTASEYEQYRGSIAVEAVDRSANRSTKNDNGRINIVDTVSPEYTVSYTPAKQVLDASTMMTRAEYSYDAQNTNSILYYDGNVDIAFCIAEANFYPEDVVIKVNGIRQNLTGWKQEGDVWTGILTLSGDGDYVVTMSYADRSGNQLTEYTSEKIVIDTAAPVISVTYDDQNAAKSIEGINYFNGVRTATIAITERNFRADDVVATVKAEDIEGNVVVVNDYAAYLSNRGNWQKNGDVYTASIAYSIDANYEFDIAYRDLALHETADYNADKFTVDKTAPQNVTITYSESILEEMLEAVTFGFYKAQATVTVTAEDETTGIHEIMLDTTKGKDVSDVNSESKGILITEDQMSRSGKTASAEIRVPQGELGAQNQFNGTVACTVSDRSGNTSDLKDDQRIVVDNIEPTINVTFDDPVREENEIAYYDGDVTVTMEINEANFYSEDVQVNVTRDGSTVSVTPQWTDESADIHIGTFTLQEEGDYLITVDYTDKSTNEMEQYTSGQLTIDTQEPAIAVSDIVANGASKEEKYGFTITAEDENLDAGAFKAVLTAVVQDGNGGFATKEISLGTAQAVEAGKTYVYRVEDLPEDAIYTLSCTAEDMAGHTHSTFSLADGTEYENVQFSINRNGSNFLLGDGTENLTEQYYVYSVEDDVVIREINVDVVENYTVRLNGVVLSENSDYRTTLSGGDGKWSERDYVIGKELFAEEGEYNLTVESKDKTDTVAYSDVKNAGVTFVVDQSAPIVTISGLENEGRYQTEEKTVNVMPTDEGGKLNSFTADILDSEGRPLENAAGEDISSRISMEGDELLSYLEENDGRISFTVPEGLNLQVQIICTDCAVQADGSTNEYNQIFKEITVSPSRWIMFYANRPLFYGTVAVICIPVAGGIAVVTLRRRKRRRA